MKGLYVAASISVASFVALAAATYLQEQQLAAKGAAARYVDYLAATACAGGMIVFAALTLLSGWALLRELSRASTR